MLGDQNESSGPVPPPFATAGPVVATGRGAPLQPRIWPVFATFGLSIVALVIGQIVVVFAVIGVRAAQGGSMDLIATDPMGGISPQLTLILTYIPAGLAFAGAAVWGALRARGGDRTGLGLQLPKLSVGGYLLLAIGSWVPFVVGALCASAAAKLGPDMSGMEAIWSASPLLLAISYVLFIGLAPGFCEEVFFRGYMQRRFLSRWSPWSAIGVASLLFALVHVMPSAIALAFPIGIWLGVMAWRTGSIWPGVLCHAVINSTWNAGQILLRQAGVTEESFTDFPVWGWVIVAVASTIVMVCFALSLRMLARRPDPALEPLPEPAFPA